MLLLSRATEPDNFNQVKPSQLVFLGLDGEHQFLLAEHAYVQTEENVLTCWICLISLIA